MSDHIPVQVTASDPPRGTGSQPAATFIAQSMSASFAWGSNPGSATIVYVGNNAPVQTGAFIELRFGRHFFAGICKSDVLNQGASEGVTRTLLFSDLREFLQWDYTFCCFNKPDHRLLGGIRLKRYKHILPSDYGPMIWSYTNSPLDASEILGAIIGGPTINTGWSVDLTGQGQFPEGLLNFPVYDFDCLNGKRLDAALNDICERSGLNFGLISSPSVPYNLVFTRKGYGALPSPPANSDNRRGGVSLSGNPTNVLVLGDRNLYQVMDVEMEPDWSRAWEKFLVFELFADDIFHRFGFDSIAGDAEGYVGRHQATARALSITVGQYAQAAGFTFVDTRKFAGRSRMDMPAALYISTLLFRAFRPSDSFVFVNDAAEAVPLTSLDIADRLLCRVSQADATDGTMQYDPTLPADGNGYAMALGYMVGSDLFKTIRPDQFTLDFFATASIWQHIPFQIDDSGEGVRFIIFDEPVIVCENLILDVDGQKVINAQAGLNVPPVRAALVFEAERFARFNGIGGKTHVENVQGLNLEVVVQGGGYVEIPYVDGALAEDKADQIAQALLLKQYVYAEGGFRLIWVPGSDPSLFGVDLSATVDRIVISTSPREGTFEVVDYTNERRKDYFEPEREFERRTQANSLFPGQSELRIQAESARKLAAAFKQLPGIRHALSLLIDGPLGNNDPLHVTWFDGNTSVLTDPMPAGTVLRKKPTKITGGLNQYTVATNPADVGAQDTIFFGVTVTHNQDPTKPFKAQRTGTALCRVKGPVKANTSVGLADEATEWEYLVAEGSPEVGIVQQDIAVAEVQLVQVALGGAAGASSEARYHLKLVKGDYLICRKTTCKNWKAVLVFNTGDNVFYGGKTYSSVGDNNSGNQPDTSPTAWNLVATFDNTEGSAAFDPAHLDGTEVYIAKEWKHRNSLLAENLGGSHVTYTYVIDPSDTTAMNVIRTTHFGSSTDREHLIPFWVQDEEIMAVPADTDVITDSNIVGGSETGLKKVTLLITGRSTEWGAF